MFWLLPLLLLGLNLTLWLAVGNLRLLSERLSRSPPPPPPSRVSSDNVAVLVPAHNEEVVIASTLTSVLRLVAPGNVHVVADGCTDHTADIARSFGVNVLELQPPHGKAGGIAAAIEHFEIPARFEAMLIVDADTELDEHYLERALPMLEQSDVVAVAGYARTTWRPSELHLLGRLIVCYRTRLYAVMQLVKYGQTWRWTNVTAIVPGFASMYRTNVLPKMDLNPPGLVIEDFNMTFEIHRKRLGKIAFRPGVGATTQDPDNARDYCRQVVRWQLGFWQTVRRHGFWRSWFSAALALFILEVLLASVVLVAIAAACGLLVLAAIAGATTGGPHWIGAPDRVLGSYITAPNVLLFLALPDYLLTCFVAAALRRPSLLVYGLGFLPIRLVDAVITLRTLPQAWRARSSGHWTSPTRRAVETGAVSLPRASAPPAPPDRPAAHPPDQPQAKGPAPARRRALSPARRPALVRGGGRPGPKPPLAKVSPTTRYASGTASRLHKFTIRPITRYASATASRLHSLPAARLALASPPARFLGQYAQTFARMPALRSLTTRVPAQLAVPIVALACWVGRGFFFSTESPGLVLSSVVAGIAAGGGLVIAADRLRPWLALALAEAVAVGLLLGLATAAVV
jgi:biofilm PGA synthesis N-glycosyltransferase PgaC